MAILDQYQFHVASDLTELDHVLAECSLINRHDRIPPHDWMQCQMAIAEGFTNAVRHAHGEKFKHCPVEIDLLLEDDRIDIRIWDHSDSKFDLEHHLQNLDVQVNEFASGGRGIIILKKIASKLAYTYDPVRQQNYLLISKNLSSRLSLYFITAKKLCDRLHDRNLVIIDCRFRLSDPTWGETQYQQSHIPGAHYLHLDRDLAAPLDIHGGRHPLPDPLEFAKILSRLGIERGKTEVVLYDDFHFAFAARCWWLLKFLGHDNISILDGGYGAWQAGSLPVSQEIPSPGDRPFIPQIRTEFLASREDLLVATDNQRVVLDCREGDRYRGEQEPIDPVAGHIPGALNAPWKQVSTDTGFAKPFDQQKALWQDYPNDQEIILYCGSGVTACVNWLSLEMTGKTNLKLYAGGWSDWCSYLPEKQPEN